MSRKKVWTKTAKKIKCKVTGLKLTEANNKKHNSRAFYKLPNGEYLSRSTEAMKKYLDEQYPNRVEHEGCNVDSEGNKLIHEEYKDTIRKLYE